MELGSGESKTVTVSRVGDGVITAVSSDTSVCTVSVSGTTVTITDGGSDGDAVVTIHIAEGTNYYAMNDLYVSVSASHGMNISELAVGSLVKCPGFTYLGSVPIFRVLEHGHRDDPAGSTTLEFRDIICLKALDAKEPNNSDGNRQNSGNNRYLYSNLLQWLNSTAGANSWYSAQHTADAPPNSSNVFQQSGTAINPYDTEAGFLSFIPSSLRGALQTVSKKTLKATIDGFGTENVSSKIFLLSTTEVGLANEGNTAEGSIYYYYVTGGTNKRKKNLASDAAKGDFSSASSPWFWWVRTPRYNGSHQTRCVSSDGSLDYGGSAYEGTRGVAPAFCIPQTTKVSLAPDTDGAYILQL